MKSSYDQFFRKAQEHKRGASPNIKAKPKAKAKPLSSEEQLREALRMRKSKKPPFPWKAAAGLVVSLGLGGLYLAAPDQLIHLIERIEINAMGSASAADKGAAQNSPTDPKETEKAAAAGASANPDQGLEASSAVKDDLSHFAKLRERKDELDMREKELVELEEELQRQKVELDKRIVQLEEMRSQIAQVLKDRVEVDQEKVTKLVDLYSNMKPKQAADVIGSINEDLAIEVLAKMKKKSAAEIMNLLPPEKARTLSEKYTGYRRKVGDKG